MRRFRLMLMAKVTGGPGAQHITLIAVNSAGTVIGSPGKTDIGPVSNAGAGGNLFLALRIDSNSVLYVINYGSSLYYTSLNSSTFAVIRALTQVTGDSNSNSFVATVEASLGQITIFNSGYGTIRFPCRSGSHGSPRRTTEAAPPSQGPPWHTPVH